jgi:hypothetical protein
LEKNLDQVIEELKGDLPVGIETFLVSNQPKVVEEAVNEFMKALWEAIAIVLVISFLNLGLRGGPGRGDLDPAGAGHRVRRHADLRDRLAAHLAGGADHRAGPARR